MPSASNYTNKIRFAASVKNTKAQLPGNVGNLTQASIAGCNLNINYTPVEYKEICCSISTSNTFVPQPDPPTEPSLLIRTLNYMTLPDVSSISQPYAGYIYIASPTTNNIHQVSVDTGTVTILDAGPLNSPSGLVVDSSGIVYIADTGNNRIQRVNLNNGAVGTLKTGALNSPLGLAVHSSGNLYIADTGNSRIQVVNVDNQTTTTLNTGTLNSPSGLAVDSSGNVYIADTGNSRIQVVNVDNQTTTTLNTGTLNSPSGLAVDSSGNVYIADTGNSRIQVVNVDNQTTTTIAGSGISGFSGDGQLAMDSQLSSATAVAVDSLGTIYIGDTGNNRIRTVYLSETLPPVNIPVIEPPSTLPELTLNQIHVLIPIVSQLKYLQNVGFIIGISTNPTFIDCLQQFRDVAGFDYFSDYILPPDPVLSNEQLRQLVPIVISLEQLLHSYIDQSTSPSYISYLTQFKNITGFDYYPNYKPPTYLPPILIGERIKMDVTLNVIHPPYQNTLFMTNIEPVQSYDIPNTSIIPTSLDITNTPNTIQETTPIIKTLKLLPGNIIPFDIKIKNNYLFILGVNNANNVANGIPEPADSIYKINIITGSLERIPLNLSENVTVLSIAVDSSYNIYLAVKERIPFNNTNKYTIQKLVNNTLIHIAGTDVPISLVFPSPSGTPPIRYNVYNGDNILATTSQISFNTLYTPNLQIYNNNLFFIDYESSRIRKIDLSTNIISTIVGPTILPIMSYAINSQGDIWFSTSSNVSDASSRNLMNICIYSNSTHQITIFGSLRSIVDIIEDLEDLKISGIFTMMFDTNDNLYIASRYSNLVYKINSQTQKWSIVAGNPNKRTKFQRTVVAGFNGDGGDPTVAQITNPITLAMDDYGSLYIQCDKVNTVSFDSEGGVIGNRVINVVGLIRKVYNIGPSLLQ